MANVENVEPIMNMVMNKPDEDTLRGGATISSTITPFSSMEYSRPYPSGCNVS